MDLSVLNNLSDPLKSILIGGAGDFLGGMAAEATWRLLDAAGYQVKKRFRPEPQQLALNQAMAEALLTTVGSLTDDQQLMVHYLGIFGEWIAREAVAGELSQIVDPHPGAELDLDLLSDEFRALGYEPDSLGAGVDFEEVVKRFVGAFYNAAAREQALQGQIQIGLLRGIALRSERQVELLEQVVAALERQGDRQPGSDAGSTLQIAGDQVTSAGPVATRGSALTTGSGSAQVFNIQGDYRAAPQPEEDTTAHLLEVAYLGRVQANCGALPLMVIDPRAAERTRQQTMDLLPVYIASEYRNHGPGRRRWERQARSSKGWR